MHAETLEQKNLWNWHLCKLQHSIQLWEIILRYPVRLNLNVNKF